MTPDGISYELLRIRLGMEERPRSTSCATRCRLRRCASCISRPERLDHWCACHGYPEAIVGGFFLSDPYRPLGEVRIDGDPIEHEAVASPWASKRGCVHIDGNVWIGPREQLADDPAGDLLQVGPLLVSGGRSLIDGEDREGFSAGAAQFDSDITVGRYPRCALGISKTELLAVCCDGRRSGVDGGLDLGELARLMISFGAEEAINLDGGGSATLVHRSIFSTVPTPSTTSRLPSRARS